MISVAAAGLAAGALASEPRELKAPGPDGDLAGTLIAPEEGKPLVLIIPGSGPTDRDGNNPLGVTAASFRLLAEELAKEGVGTLRIDKRGMFGSKAAIPDPNQVTVSGYADDVHAWIAVARQTTGVPCVWVLGHSEGGLIALEAAQRDGNICGLLLVASVGRPLGDILREQLRSNPLNAPLLDEAFAAIDKLEAGDTVSTEGMHPGLKPLFATSVQGYLADMMSRRPSEMIGRVEQPVLIVAGGKDLQTPVADGEALASGKSDAKLLTIPDMNHVLKAVAEEGRGPNFATYGDPSLPVHPDLVAGIVEFLPTAAD